MSNNQQKDPEVTYKLDFALRMLKDSIEAGDADLGGGNEEFVRIRKWFSEVEKAAYAEIEAAAEPIVGAGLINVISL